jgi:hypothetical protein
MSDEIENERAIIMCSRPNPEISDQIPGNVEIMGHCGHRIMVAPASQEFIGHEAFEFMCTFCALQEPSVRKAINERSVSYTAKHKEEMLKLVGEEVFANLAERFGLIEREF